MNKKKSVYVEKINKDKSEKESKQDLMNLIIPHFHVDDEKKAKAINTVSGNNNPILGQYLPFFYLNMTQIRNIPVTIGDTTQSDILSYLNKVKDDVAYCFGFPLKHQEIWDTIIAIDRPGENVDINMLPRSKKLNRLRMIHKNIIEYFLQSLHDLLWISIKENKKSSKDLNYYIQSLYPIMKKLIHDLEEEVDKEFPVDLIEKQMKIEYKKR